MDLASLIFSGLSIIVALVGTVLSNNRARDALQEARNAATGTLWAEAQTAVQRLVGFDPATEPVGERLVNLRIALVALVDAHKHWPGFDSWLATEHQLGSALARQVLDKASPTDTADQRLRILDPYLGWAMALGSNLRFLRSDGFDPEPVRKLREHAEQLTTQVYEVNGWVQPPIADMLSPLDH